jgi:ubiquitin-conjugating enzyme E2 J2
MATKAAHKRLTREYAAIQANPPPYIEAHPSESNILEWHYILTGAPDTPYDGGQYWGTLVFPSDYPFAPPAIRMHTPSGRFQTSTRLCLSISDFHPKSFNPAWSVSTILIGLLSFMNSEEMTAGSLSSSKRERSWLAARSRWWNSTGGGSCGTKTRPGNNISATKSSGNANIKAGDGGRRFREEFEELDAENWKWMEEVGIDPLTGKVAPPPAATMAQGDQITAGQAGSTPEKECSPEVARLRGILGGGAGGTSLGQAAREAGEGWIGRWKWYLVGGFVAYVIATRVVSWD